MTIPTNNMRTQVRNNTEALQKVSDRDNPVFRRISDTATRGDISPVAYMVTGPHSTKYGFYHCLPLQIDGSTFEAGYSTAGVKMKNVDYTIGPLSGGVGSFPDAWSSTNDYDEGDLVSVGRQVYKALRDNLNRNPETETDDWIERTVEVLNLSEWMGWDGTTEPPENTNEDAAITELLPKLVYLDTIVASNQLTTGGDNVIAGFDNIGFTRLFDLELLAESTNTQQFDAYAIKADGTIVGSSGEGLFNVKIIPYASTFADGDSNSLKQYWADPATQSGKHETCVWIKGMWYWTPSVQKNEGSTHDVFKDGTGLYCGRIIGNGLKRGGASDATEIQAAVSGSEAMEINVSGELAVKVDAITIDFNGSGELEQIP